MSESIGQAIASLTQAIQEDPALSAENLMQIATLIPTLHQYIAPVTAAGSEPQSPAEQDPRLALALASCAETAAHAALRTQIFTAHLIEATSAHTLTVDELDALRAGTTDFSSPAQRTAARSSFCDATTLLAAWLQLEHFEAQRRIQDAHHVFAQFDYQHVQYPPQFPLLTQHFFAADRPPAESLSAARRLAALEPPHKEFDPPSSSTLRTDDGQLVEAILSDSMGETDTKTRRKRINAELRAARERQSEEHPEEQEGIYRKGLRHGLVRYEVALRPLRAEVFESLLAQSDNPRSGAGRAAREAYVDESADDEAPAEGYPDFLTAHEVASAQEPEPTEVSVAARRLNALMLLIQLNASRLAGSREAPDNRSAPGNSAQANTTSSSTNDPDPPVVKPQVVVTLTLAELEGRAETYGITSHGFQLSATDLRQTLARASIIPIVLGGKGEVLDIGRSQRKHPKYMRLGVAVRDRGCIVPGCTMPPERCNIHHIQLWSEGGVTAVFWSAMLCDTHHHDVHAGLMTVIPDGGVPKVILPRFMDPTQTPVRNTCNWTRAA